MVKFGGALSSSSFFFIHISIIISLIKYLFVYSSNITKFLILPLKPSLSREGFLFYINIRLFNILFVYCTHRVEAILITFLQKPISASPLPPEIGFFYTK